MSFKYRFRRGFKVLALLIGLVVMPWSVAGASGDIDWDRWKTHDPAQTAAPDHRYLTVFLESYSEFKRGQFLVAYDALGRKGTKFLEAYISYLEGLPVSRLNRDEQLTIWINLYNAGTIHAIATWRKLPKRMNIHRGVPGTPGKMWSKKRFTVEGFDLSLEDIEMNILARHWSGGKDGAMFIYGLTYGARGSPPLPGVAFVGNRVNTQLAESARTFVNQTFNVKVSGTNASLSRLYGWHGALLGENDADIIKHVKSFAGNKLAAQLGGATTITTDRFNWRLNSIVLGSTSLGAPGLGDEGGGGGEGGGP